MRPERGWKTWWREYAGSVAFGTTLVLAAILAAVSISIAKDAHEAATNAHEAAKQAQQFSRTGLNQTIQALYLNCRQDHKFRTRYRARGHASILFLHTLPQNRATKLLERRSRPIPTPKCQQEADQLRRELFHKGDS